MHLFVIMLSLICCCCPQERYGKTYGSKAVEAKRREIYIDNSRMIVAHNARYDRSEVSYRLKMNQFGDMVCFMMPY